MNENVMLKKRTLIFACMQLKAAGGAPTTERRFLKEFGDKKTYGRVFGVYY
jgi:hypothetical protein